MYSGRLIAALNEWATVNSRHHGLCSSVTGSDPWAIVTNARGHLANNRMTVGDVMAWDILGEAQGRLIHAGSVRCQVDVEYGVGVVPKTYACGKPCLSGSIFCAEHAEDGDES